MPVRGETAQGFRESVLFQTPTAVPGNHSLPCDLETDKEERVNNRRKAILPHVTIVLPNKTWQNKQAHLQINVSVLFKGE